VCCERKTDAHFLISLSNEAVFDSFSVTNAGDESAAVKRQNETSGL